MDGVSKEALDKINELINENVEFVEEEESEASETPEQEAAPEEAPAGDNAAEEEEEYFCPECGAKITLDMTHCPKCVVEFEFEVEE